MKKCPDCGAPWNGKEPCPSCGAKPEDFQNDHLFQPPEEGGEMLAEPPPEFDAEELLRWEPSPDPASAEPEEETLEEEEEDSLPEETEEEPLRPQSRFKRWQKITAAAVAAAVVITAAAVTLWPHPQTLPEEPAFFVQNNTLMALPVGGEPQEVAPYVEAMEYDMWVSPDQKSVVWLDRQDLRFYMDPPEGEAFQLPNQNFTSYPLFSQDSRYMYYSTAGENYENTLYRYEMETGEEREVGAGSAENLKENGSLIAAYGYTNFSVYDAETLEQKWSQDTRVVWADFMGDQLYYLEQAGNDLNIYRLCRWQEDQPEVLMEDVRNPLMTTDGILYLSCPSGKEIPMCDLIENDMGSKGQTILEQLEGETVRIPDESLYCFQNGQLRYMGEKLERHAFPEVGNGILARTVTYQPPEETTFSLAQIMGACKNSGEFLAADVASYMSGGWPEESSLDYVGLNGRLFRLPDDVPQSPGTFRTAGDWICIYNSSDELSECGLWLGHIQGEEIVYENFYMVSDISNFVVTAQGDLYYWGGQGGTFVGPIYKNGVPIITNANLQNVQATEDGAVYFLSGSSASATLNRVYQGNLEVLAEGVNNFNAYTGDYALYLQSREDSGWDLYRYQGGKTAIVAEQVDSLLPVTTQAYPQLMSPYSDVGSMGAETYGGVDGSGVTTGIVD